MSLLDVQLLPGVSRIDYVIHTGTRTFAMQFSALGWPPFPWARHDPILARFFHVELPEVTLPACLCPASDLQLDRGSVFERLLRVLYDDKDDDGAVFGSIHTEALAIMVVYADFISADRALRRLEAELARRPQLICDPELLEFTQIYGLRCLQQRCLYDWLVASGPRLERYHGFGLHELVEAIYAQAETPLVAFLQLARIVARIQMPADELLAGQYVIVVDNPVRMQHLTDLVMGVEFLAGDLNGAVRTASMLRDLLQPDVHFQIQMIVDSLKERQREQRQQMRRLARRRNHPPDPSGL